MGRPYNATNNGTVAQIESGSLKTHLLTCDHDDSGKRFFQIFDKAAADVTLGTTAPSLSLPMPASGGCVIDIPLRFAQGLSYAVTTTSTGSTGPSSPANVNAIYE